MAVKKIIATTVSSREKGMRRREEGWTMSIQKTISLQRNQNNERCTSEGGGRDKLMKVDGDFPTCMRIVETIMMTKEKMEDLRGKGGGRLKHRTIDGDVPLCLRKTEKESNDDSSSKGKNREEKETNEALCHELKWRAEAKICVYVQLEKEMTTEKTKKLHSFFLQKKKT